MSSFSNEQIQTSKTLLFDALPAKKQYIQHKGDGKGERHLRDIIHVFRTVDLEAMPVFVA